MNLQVKVLLLAASVSSLAQPVENGKQLTISDGLTPTEIVMRAVDVANHSREEEHDLLYEFSEETISEQFDTAGHLSEREITLSKVYPLAGALYREVIAKNGQPLPEKELERERHRKDEAHNRRKRGEQEKENYRIRFDRELVDRYHIKLLEEQRVGGRPVYTVWFEPKSNSLPVRHRMDYALNKSHGLILIDKKTFQVARVEFELIEPVRLWWGILGRLHTVKGLIERKPLADGIWVGQGLDFSMNIRIFFKVINTRRRTKFVDYQPVK